MSSTVCDTHIPSEIVKGIDLRIVRNADVYLKAHGELRFTSVTRMEILYGLYRKGALVQASRVESVLGSHLEVLPTRADYRLAAEILGALDRQGTPIGRLDPLIAACAINRDLTLATGNLRHFGHVAAAGFALRLADWRAA